MPIPSGIPYDFREIANKMAMLLGILIVVYALLWILAELKLIPVVLFAIFPQIVLLLIGIFIVYIAYSRRNSYMILKLFFKKRKN